MGAANGVAAPAKKSRAAAEYEIRQETRSLCPPLCRRYEQSGASRSCDHSAAESANQGMACVPSGNRRRFLPGDEQLKSQFLSSRPVNSHKTRKRSMLPGEGKKGSSGQNWRQIPGRNRCKIPPANGEGIPCRSEPCNLPLLLLVCAISQESLTAPFLRVLISEGSYVGPSLIDSR